MSQKSRGLGPADLFTWIFSKDDDDFVSLLYRLIYSPGFLSTMTMILCPRQKRHLLPEVCPAGLPDIVITPHGRCTHFSSLLSSSPSPLSPPPAPELLYFTFPLLYFTFPLAIVITPHGRCTHFSLLLSSSPLSS